ncbi:MAG: hypothetical protein CME36_12795 [unclassified Hahellaceae]|nr:hypothetical protein [Hahellaceae bacterium]|tara:strand:+ start:90106 stop:92868 length:2763 start_codon:yes stop_codon:yes gene_type:complete
MSDIDFRAVFKAMPGHHCLLKPGPEGLEILACSDQLPTLKAFGGQDPTGRPLADFFHDAHSLKDLQLDPDQPVEKLSSVEQGLALSSKTTGRLLVANSSIIADENGAMQYVLLRLTEFAGAEPSQTAGLSIEQERMLLASVIDRTTDFVGIADFNARGVLINRSGRNLLGIAQDFDVSEITLFDIFSPAEHQLIRDEAIPSLMCDGYYNRDMTLQHLTTGENVPIELFAFRIDDPVTGEPLYLATISRDRRERLKIDEATQNEYRTRLFDAALSNLTNHVYVLNTDGSFRYINLALLKALGTTFEHAVGKTFSQLDYPATLANRLMRQVKQVIDTRKPLVDRTTFRTATAGTRLFEYTWVPVFAADGRVEAIAGSSYDITAQAQIEEQLEGATKASERANMAKSEFLANMSHEIRTPMTAILGFADILASHLSDPDDLSAVETIRRNGRHLLDIINDILDLSRIEAGRLTVRNDPVAIGALIDDVHTLMSVSASKKRLPLNVKYPKLLPAQISTDEKRVRQILINLIGNAVKFTETGSVSLKVVLEQGEQPALFFEVSDTGIGLSAQFMNSVFEPFSQADTSHSRSYEGSGLGLPISQRLANLLGGVITGESRPGRGSTFRFRLPIERSAMENLKPPQKAKKPNKPPAEIPELRCRVLVVDDRHDIRFLAQHVLEEAGARVATASDGLEALSVVQQASLERLDFDIILMDMQMPVMDGYEAVTRLRKLGFTKPILALTAAAMQTDRDRCLTAGCTGYLSKPVESQHLLAMVAYHIGVGPAPEPSSHVPELLPPGLPQVAETTATEKPRILLVEDSADAREATAMLLRAAGFSVDEAETGASAVEQAAAAPHDIVLLDLGLPDMDGYDVAKQLSSEDFPFSGRIFAMSGRVEDPDESRRSGIHHHLLKPVSWHDLRDLLTK